MNLLRPIVAREPMESQHEIRGFVEEYTLIRFEGDAPLIGASLLLIFSRVLIVGLVLDAALALT